MGADYRYDIPQMQGFLSAVQDSLAKGVPSHVFTFTGDFISKALNLRVGVLIGAINDRTT